MMKQNMKPLLVTLILSILIAPSLHAGGWWSGSSGTNEDSTEVTWENSDNLSSYNSSTSNSYNSSSYNSSKSNNSSYGTDCSPPFIYDSCDCCPLGLIGPVFDRHFSPYTGGSYFISILRGYMKMDDYFYPDSRGDTNGYMILGRLTKFALEATALSTMMVAQHEVFGHGWRAREFGTTVLGYKIQPFSGSTELSAYGFNQLLFTQQAAISTGGMEANTILAKQLKIHWLPTQSLDEREGLFYLLTYLDQTRYVLKTASRNTFSDGNDVIAYISEVNNWYGSPVLSRQNLKNKVLIDFLDPFLWYSLYGVGNYLYDGTQCFQYPMIPIGDYKYLPGMRLVLAPYGPEYSLINYIRACNYVLQVTLRYGRSADKNSMAVVLERTNLWSAGDLLFDGRLDVWAQPKVLVSYAYQTNRPLGIALSLTAHYRIGNCMEILGQAGYKTSGYMPGDALKRGPILRLGFGFYL